MTDGGRPTLRVGFILANSFTLSAFSLFVDALRLAGDEGDLSRPIRCQWPVMAARTDPVRSSCGLLVTPTSALLPPDELDYVVVVGGLLRHWPGARSRRRAPTCAVPPAAGTPLVRRVHRQLPAVPGGPDARPPGLRELVPLPGLQRRVPGPGRGGRPAVLGGPRPHHLLRRQQRGRPRGAISSSGMSARRRRRRRSMSCCSAASAAPTTRSRIPPIASEGSPDRREGSSRPADDGAEPGRPVADGRGGAPGRPVAPAVGSGASNRCWAFARRRRTASCGCATRAGCSTTRRSA